MGPLVRRLAICLLFTAVFFSLSARAQDDEFVATVRIEQMNSVDLRGRIEYFEVRFPKHESVTISADSSLEFTRWLRGHQHRPVSLSLK
jgi:hypothetical protein